jgi:condensin complex subunit 1
VREVPDVENWSTEESDEAMNALTRRVLKSQGRDLAEEKSFAIMYALVQAWPHLEEGLQARVAELLTDAQHRLRADADRLKKVDKAASKSAEKEKHLEELREVRTTVKVVVFYLRLTVEKVLKEASVQKRRGRKRAAGGDEEKEEQEKEKERQKAVERQRCSLLSAVVDSIAKGAMPWLWLGDTASWSQVAEKVSDSGFAVLDAEQALKHKETRQFGLRCIVEPLQQEGHEHSNLLVATVSKLTHSLRGHELAAPFAADAVGMAHNTPLPRTLLIELTNQCTGSQLASQGAFQRSLGALISGLAERLPHVVLANISVLLELFNVDCYPLRSAIVESIGSLLTAEGRPLPQGARCKTPVVKTSEENGGEEGQDAQAEAVESEGGPSYFKVAPATKTDLLEHLMTRCTDKTVWVRVQTLRTLTNLARSQKALPKELWPRALQIATKRMQDTASSARKSALGLVHILVQVHPYGPSLKGSGDERAKSEQILRYIGDRKQALINEAAAEELKEAEQMLQKAKGDDNDEEIDCDVPTELPTQEEGPAKRRRLGKKTNHGEAPLEYEVDDALAAEAEEGESRYDQRIRELKSLENMEQCYADRFKFVEMLDITEPRLRSLLVSRNPSDVIEAIGVVVELKRRGLPAAARAFNQILGLVWSKHTNVKDAAVEAFFNMHLEGYSAEQAVQSLLEMYQVGCSTGGWTYTHLASVSELIQQAATQERIDPVGAISSLMRCLQGPLCPMALRTLTALGSADTKQLTKSLPQLAQLFGPQGPCWNIEPAQRLERTRLLCQMLQRLVSCVKPQFASGSVELGQVWALCQQATQVVLEDFSKGNVAAQWFGAAQAAMDLCFDLSAYAAEDGPSGMGCPDKQWESILEGMLRAVLQSGQLKQSAPIADEGMPADGEGEEKDEMAEEQSSLNADVKAPASQLGCTVFIVGHFALRMVIYMESTQTMLKKKRTSEEDARIEAEREKKKQKETKKKGKKSGGKEEDEKKEDEDESTGMGMAGQEEREAEHFADMIETRLLYNPKSILSRARPLLLRGLFDPQQRSNPVIRRIAAISLCKFMTISKRFCQDHLQLIFSVLFPKGKEQASLLAADDADGELVAQDAATQGGGGSAGELLEDLTLRQSLLVAVGDLLIRHPNVVEPWTNRLYSALGNPTGSSAESIAKATNLRLTALLVLTHLVLNDMMKPRAVLLGRALWLTACPHESTARVARILFQELSKRSNNVIYNLLPEVIAGLPAQKEESASPGVAGNSAEERVSWVMQFVEKEKHIEGLIEKMSHRLEKSSDIKGMGKDGCNTQMEEDENEDGCDLPQVPSSGMETVSCLAHALGAMNYSDRCIIRLHDVIVIRKALNISISYHQVVRDCILGIVEKSRKPRVGKAAGEGQAAPAEGENAEAAAGAKGKFSDAAVKAVDEIENVINTLGAKKKAAAADAPEVEVVPTPQGGRAVLPVQETSEQMPSKRKQDEADGENIGAEPAKKKGRGKGAKKKQEDADGPNKSVTVASEPSLAERMATPASSSSAPAAPPVKKVASGGEELRAALAAQKAARKGKGKGKAARRAGSKCDDDEEH